MSDERLITPVWTEDARALVDRLAHQLEWALDNPMGQPKPIGLTGVLEQLGALLWDAAGLDAHRLRVELERARDQQRPLRLTVTDPDSADLPWELLFHGDPDLQFLARHPWCVMMRRVAGDGTKQPICLPRPFRMLRMVAAPEDLDPERTRLDYKREEELLFTALDEPIGRGEVEIDVAEDGCLETLLDRLGQTQYHAVNLSMHGALATGRNGEQEWRLLFEDRRTGLGRAVAGSQLARHFDELDATLPGLVVLSACRSARLADSGVSDFQRRPPSAPQRRGTRLGHAVVRVGLGSRGEITGRPLTAEQQYFYEMSYKEPVESIARIEETAKFLAGAVTGVSGLFLAAFRLALAGLPAEGLIWYAPVLLWGASLAMLMLVLFPGRYATSKNEPAAWKAAFTRTRKFKYAWLCAGAVLFFAGLVAATWPLVK